MNNKDPHSPHDVPPVETLRPVAHLELKAAALLESVVRNHPFVDGNKRSGWTLLVAFLWINGRRHDFTTDEGFALVIGVAEGRLDLVAVDAHLRSHTPVRD